MLGSAKAHAVDKLWVLMVSPAKGRSAPGALASLRACSSSVAPGGWGHGLAAASPRAVPAAPAGLAAGL